MSKVHIGTVHGGDGRNGSGHSGTVQTDAVPACRVARDGAGW